MLAWMGSIYLQLAGSAANPAPSILWETTGNVFACFFGIAAAKDDALELFLKALGNMTVEWLLALSRLPRYGFSLNIRRHHTDSTSRHLMEIGVSFSAACWQIQVALWSPLPHNLKELATQTWLTVSLFFGLFKAAGSNLEHIVSTMRVLPAGFLR